MKVIRSIPVLENEQKLRGWLRAVIMSCAYDRLRKETRARRRDSVSIASQSAMTSDSDTRERMAWMQQELTKLDAGVHPFMVLRYRLGWTLERIGELMGLKPGAVDGRIRRATKHLREKAAKYDDRG